MKSISHNIGASPIRLRNTHVPGIRIGMWVTDLEGNRLGVVTRTFKASIYGLVELRREDVLRHVPESIVDGIEISLCNDDGTASLTFIDYANGWKQASLSDIPESRRPTKQIAQTLGYL